MFYFLNLSFVKYVFTGIHNFTVLVVRVSVIGRRNCIVPCPQGHIVTFTVAEVLCLFVPIMLAELLPLWCFTILIMPLG